MRSEIIAFIFALLIISGMGQTACDRASPKTHEVLEAQETVSGESIYQLQTELVDQEGNPAGLDVFSGHPVIVSLFYASCTYSCPLLIESVKKLEKKLDPATLSKTRVLLISFDPKRDTPEVLSKLGRDKKIDLTRWRLATAPDEKIREIAAVLGIKYKPLPNGDFNHSSVVALLDQGGVIAAAIDGFNASLDPLAPRLRDLATR